MGDSRTVLAERTSVRGGLSVVRVRVTTAALLDGADRRIDPADLIPRSLGRCGDALCVAVDANPTTTRASWTCRPTSILHGGHSSPTRSGTWG